MNKGGYSTPPPPQYRNNDYRYPPGPSRYQPYNHPPPDRFDSRQRPVMQSDYYPEPINYPSPRPGRPELPPRDDIPPPLSRGRGRERDFNGTQYNRPPPSPGPPPVSPPFRDYPSPRFSHPPPYNINSAPNSSHNPPIPNTPPHNINPNSNNSNNHHPNYNSPRERPPDYPIRDLHYRQESPKPPPPSPLKQQQPPPNSPNIYHDFRMVPPDNRLPPNIPPPFHRSNDFPMNPNIDDLQNLPNNPQFPINSPPRAPIHLMMPIKQNIPILHPLNPMVNPVPLNPVEIETKLNDSEELRNFMQEIDLDLKKYHYDKSCRKIETVQAKLHAIVNKLAELEDEKPSNAPSSL